MASYLKGFFAAPLHGVEVGIAIVPNPSLASLYELGLESTIHLSPILICDETKAVPKFSA